MIVKVDLQTNNWAKNKFKLNTWGTILCLLAQTYMACIWNVHGGYCCAYWHRIVPHGLILSNSFDKRLSYPTSTNNFPSAGSCQWWHKKAKEKYGTTAAVVFRSFLPVSVLIPSVRFTVNVRRVSLACGHVMCDQCAIRSIETQQKCPFCQRPAATDDIRRIY